MGFSKYLDRLYFNYDTIFNDNISSERTDIPFLVVHRHRFFGFGGKTGICELNH